MNKKSMLTAANTQTDA